MKVEIKPLNESFGKTIFEGLNELLFLEETIRITTEEGTMEIPMIKIGKIVFDKKENYHKKRTKTMKIVPSDNKSIYINDYISHNVHKNLLVINREKKVEIFNLNTLEYFSFK